MNTDKIINTALSRVGDEKRLKSYLESQSKIVERDYFYQLDYFVDELLLVVEREIKRENFVLKKRTDILNAEIARLEANTDNFLIYPSYTSKSWSDMSESERNQSKEDERIRLINKNKEILNKETESLTKKINRLETLKRAINDMRPGSKSDCNHKFTAKQWAVIFYFVEHEYYEGTETIKGKINKFMADWSIDLSHNSIYKEYNNFKSIDENKKPPTSYTVKDIKTVIPFIEEHYYESFRFAESTLNEIIDEMERIKQNI